jgi:AcrR family transcriptional regulator
MSTNTKRPDRRRERTRRQLGDALVSLILERGYDAIRIEDISDRADLGRATFYLHFRSKDDLLMATLERVYDELVEQIRALPLEALQNNSVIPSAIAFRHAAENRDLYRVMLRSQSTNVISARLRGYLAERVYEQISLLLGAFGIHDTPTSPVLVSQYIASSLLGMITWWLESDSPLSADEMAAIAQKMNRAAAAAALGLPAP